MIWLTEICFIFFDQNQRLDVYTYQYIYFHMIVLMITCTDNSDHGSCGCALMWKRKEPSDLMESGNFMQQPVMIIITLLIQVFQ